jgi:hypothetical protein
MLVHDGKFVIAEESQTSSRQKLSQGKQAEKDARCIALPLESSP